MRVGLLGYGLGYRSGTTRFLVNIAKGLAALGHQPVVVSVYLEQKIVEELERHKICYIRKFNNAGILGNLANWSYSKSRYRKRMMENMLVKAGPLDLIVVIDDIAINLSELQISAKKIFIIQGDLSLIVLGNDFRKKYRILSRIFSSKLVKDIIRHSTLCQKYDLVIANSNFTRGFMSYLYNAPIKGVVYPPVDQSIFHPTKPTDSDNPFLLTLLRDEKEEAYKYVQHLAKSNRVIVVGGGKVEGALNVGSVTDKELVDYYSSATAFVSPSYREWYGYPLAEAISCGTPVLAFNAGGASELIQNGVNGWLVYDIKEMAERAKDLLHNRGTKFMKARIVESSHKFSIESSVSKLLNLASSFDET